MAFPMRSTRSFIPVSMLPRRKSSQPSGTATISAEAMTEASKHCTTTRSHRLPVGQYRRPPSACSSPAVEQIIMGVPANRAEIVFAT